MPNCTKIDWVISTHTLKTTFCRNQATVLMASLTKNPWCGTDPVKPDHKTATSIMSHTMVCHTFLHEFIWSFSYHALQSQVTLECQHNAALQEWDVIMLWWNGYRSTLWPLINTSAMKLTWPWPNTEESLLSVLVTTFHASEQSYFQDRQILHKILLQTIHLAAKFDWLYTWDSFEGPKR